MLPSDSAIYMHRVATNVVDFGIDTKPCEVCGIVEGDGVLCDRCDKAFHIGCLSEEKKAQVEQPYWFCDECLEEVV